MSFSLQPYNLPSAASIGSYPPRHPLPNALPSFVYKMEPQSRGRTITIIWVLTQGPGQPIREGVSIDLEAPEGKLFSGTVRRRLMVGKRWTCFALDKTAHDRPRVLWVENKWVSLSWWDRIVDWFGYLREPTPAYVNSVLCTSEPPLFTRRPLSPAGLLQQPSGPPIIIPRSYSPVTISFPSTPANTPQFSVLSFDAMESEASVRCYSLSPSDASQLDLESGRVIHSGSSPADLTSAYSSSIL